MAEVAAVKEPIVFTLRTELHGSHAWVTVFARGAHAGVLRLRPEEVEPFRTRLVAVPGYDSEEQRIWQGANAWQADRIAELERELTATRALMALAKEALLEGSAVIRDNAERLEKHVAASGDGRCPRCDSPAPKLHPAIQWEGEVHLCNDPWHSRVHDLRASFVNSPVAPGGWGPNDVPPTKAGERD